MRKPILIGAIIVVATIATVFATARSGLSVPFVADYPDKIDTTIEKIGQNDTASTAPTLTDEEKSRVLEIAKNDPRVKAILDHSSWQALLIGPWTDEGVQKGGVVLIRLDKAVWAEGEFGVPGAKAYRASLWVGNLHVNVDLQKNVVVGVEPGIGKPSGPTPTNEIIDNAKAVAKSRAVAELNNTNVEAKLLAVYYNSEFPKGAAMFVITSEQGDEMATGVDLSQNQIIEKYTVRAVK
ncbi:hypothetical protein [Nitrososphaera viennensis]|uniref:Uncharacterized protein n=2 Tax=Nitrososphaera viennensis TaxID=1034015 RepID=A0A060HJK8_9ARCH|nr:hypothetical protein [Nitrososphaera viennensis]AIC15435.1 exported protein of unknown function [Nitrososphaera viennensis EN76]UVS70326.1 hypothetical protein NWT39_05950 [Nitrososphaera viennensis]